MADDDTRDTRGPKSWNKFDARLAALAAATAGDRPRPPDDPMRPFDTVVAASIAATPTQPEKPAPVDKAMSAFDAKVAAMLAEANSSGPATSASAGVIEAERKPPASAGAEAELERPLGVQPARTVAPAQVRPAETAEDIARRIAAELAAENEIGPPPPPPAARTAAPELQPPRTADAGQDLLSRLNAEAELRPVQPEQAPRLVDVEPEPAHALRIEPEPDPSLRIEPEPDRSLRIDPDRDRPAPTAPEVTSHVEAEPHAPRRRRSRAHPVGRGGR